MASALSTSPMPIFRVPGLWQMAVGAYDNHILLGVNSASFIQRVRYPEAETFELQIQERAGYSEDYFCLPHRQISGCCWAFQMALGTCVWQMNPLCCHQHYQKIKRKESQKAIISNVNVSNLVKYNAVGKQIHPFGSVIVSFLWAKLLPDILSWQVRLK